MKKNLLLIFCIMLVARFLFSQEIPAQNKTVQQTEKQNENTFLSLVALDDLKEKGPMEKKWFFSIGGWYERKTGNTDTWISNGSIQLLYDNTLTRVTLYYNFFYNTADGKANENSRDSLFQLDHCVASRVELFTFSKSEYDKILNIQLRNNSGAGAKFIFIRNKFILADLSGAPVYQYEKYENEDAGDELFASFRFRVKIVPAPALILQLIYFYIPYYKDIGNFKGASDYRTTLDAFAELNIARFKCRTNKDDELTDCRQQRGIYLKAGYMQKFNNTPAPGTKKTDTTYYAQVSLKL